jgi:hypothetical protein
VKFPNINIVGKILCGGTSEEERNESLTGRTTVEMALSVVRYRNLRRPDHLIVTPLDHPYAHRGLTRLRLVAFQREWSFPSVLKNDINDTILFLLS